MNNIIKPFIFTLAFFAIANTPYATATGQDGNASQNSWAVFSGYTFSPSTMVATARQWLPSWSNLGQRIYDCQCTLRNLSPWLLGAYLMLPTNCQSCDIESIIEESKLNPLARPRKHMRFAATVPMNFQPEIFHEYDYENDRQLIFRGYKNLGNINSDDRNKVKTAVNLIVDEIIPNLQLRLPRQVDQIDDVFSRYFNLNRTSSSRDLMQVRRNFDSMFEYWRNLDLNFYLYNFRRNDQVIALVNADDRRSIYHGIVMNLVHLRNAPIYELALIFFHEGSHDSSGYDFNRLRLRSRNYFMPRIFNFLPDSPSFALTNAIVARPFYTYQNDQAAFTEVRILDYAYQNYSAIGLNAIWNAASYHNYAFNILRTSNLPLTEQQQYNYQMVELNEEVRGVIFESALRERILNEYAEPAINYFVQRYGGQLSLYYQSLMRNELVQIWQRTRAHLSPSD